MLLLFLSWNALAAVESVKMDVSPRHKWGAEMTANTSFGQSGGDAGLRDGDSALILGPYIKPRKNLKFAVRQAFKLNKEEGTTERDDPYLYASFLKPLEEARYWAVKARIYAPGSEKSLRRNTYKARLDWLFGHEVNSWLSFEHDFQHRHYVHRASTESKIDDDGEIEKNGLKMMQLAVYSSALMRVNKYVRPFVSLGLIGEWSNATGKTPAHTQSSLIDIGSEFHLDDNLRFSVLFEQNHGLNDPGQDFILFNSKESLWGVELKAAL